jgi:hypothetical protein
VATVNGNRMSILTRPGRVVPNYRAQAPAMAANVFEAVGAVNETRTIQRNIDAALKVVAPVFLEGDSRLWIARLIDRFSDAGQLIIRLDRIDADLAVRIARPLSSRGDTRQAVFVKLDSSSDCSQLVIHTEERQAAARQTVFAVLINESHEVQT